MSPDYKKTLELTNKFNQLVKEFDLEKEFYILDSKGKRYNFLATFQMSIFSEFKIYADKERVDPENKNSQNFSIKAFLMQLVLLFISTISFLYFAINRKQKLIIFSLDKMSDKKNKRDARVSCIYNEIKSKRISTLEIMHTVPNLISLKNFFARKTPMIFFQSIQFLVIPFARPKFQAGSTFLDNYLKDANSEDKKQIIYILNKYLIKVEQIKKTIPVWKFIFKVTNSKNLWAVEDVRRLAEILFAVKEIGGKSYMFQQGHYTKYHLGFLSGIFNGEEIIKSEYIVVWNKYWKKELLRLGTYFKESVIIVGGENKLNTFQTVTPSVTVKSILIPFETDAPKEEVKKYIEKFLNEGIVVYFKLRKDWTMEAQIKYYNFGDNIIKNKNFVCVFDENEVVEKHNQIIDCVAGVYSSYLYDVLYLGKPVLLLDTSMDYGEGMVQNGLALKFGLNDDLNNVPENYKKIEKNVIDFYENPKDVKVEMDKIYQSML